MAVFFNQATLSYDDRVINSNIVTGEIVDVLSVTKTALDDVYSINGDLTYIVNIVNTGAVAFTNLTVTDNLGAFTPGSATVYPLTYKAGSLAYFINGVEQTNPTVTATQPLTLSGISVPAGGNATIIYQATANGFAPPVTGSQITNTVTVSGAQLTTPVTATETVTVASAASLTISKSLSPSTVADNSPLTYTIVIQNFGNEAVGATDNAVVTDTFDPVLSDILVTYNGTVWTEGVNYTYDTNGNFATLPGQITVPAAQHTQDPATGEWTTDPGFATLVITGTV